MILKLLQRADQGMRFDRTQTLLLYFPREEVLLTLPHLLKDLTLRRPLVCLLRKSFLASKIASIVCASKQRAQRTFYSAITVNKLCSKFQKV